MKKVLALILVLAAMFSLASCGKKKAKTQLEDIIDSGVVTIALSPDFAPMEFIDPSKEGMDQYQGFDVELCKYVAAELSAKYGKTITLSIEAMEFDACQLAVGSKQVHMSISGYSRTPAREESYLMSDYYYAGDNESEQWLIAFADKAAEFGTAADLAGKKVAAQNASLQQALLEEQLPDSEEVIITSLDTAILELVNGKVDALCVAQGQADVFINQYPELAKCGFQFEVAAEQEANVVLMAQGEDDLCEVVNEILAKALASGVYGQWYETSVAYANAIGAFD